MSPRLGAPSRLGLARRPIGSAGFGICETNTSERVLRARIASVHRWSVCEDRSAATLPGRQALASKDERAVDPDMKLNPDERAKRVALRRQERALRAALIRWHGR